MIHNRRSKRLLTGTQFPLEKSGVDENCVFAHDD